MIAGKAHDHDGHHLRHLHRKPVRGRFAPSPTGVLHFGSLLAALGSFLDIRQKGGEWWLRIEDLDPPRTVPGAIDHILQTLEIYGLHWDGQVVYQSQRHPLYRAALEQLRQQDIIYPCSCSRREIAQEAAMGAAGPIYPGYCRNGVRHTQRPTAIRVRVADRNIQFHDAIQGHYYQNLSTATGDFVLRRADGLFAYQLAVVVDDAEQNITDIMRGCDLLASTPKQIYLQTLLGFPIPNHAHLPVAVNQDGQKLSKQTGACPLDRRQPGFTLVSALRALGQNPPPDLASEAVPVILGWAVNHWSLAHVPRSLKDNRSHIQGNESTGTD
ncbi:MAG: tRNA glutamyl-Q(34) synthetase GluQRS [Candidatus Contendobacter odensis]|uniref:Glutamyl-Q tRNA(Asp) synthetase n=1 Tax=Candidatus Contendibacter odensensis TaxID=1400860 RepID=A0A2G6PF31_9GAMM|nr:MAG: tRNA glutamyl-Q(34) synthetase GluQRS [Candidatus Contendobacter odensis]